jgi:hypothetical protein
MDSDAGWMCHTGPFMNSMTALRSFVSFSERLMEADMFGSVLVGRVCLDVVLESVNM